MEAISQCCAMSVSTKVTTVVCTLLLLTAVVALVYGVIKTSSSVGLKAIEGGIAALLLILFGLTVAHMPRQVAVGNEGIKVQLLCRDIQIPASEIDSVQLYPKGMPAYRICGTGSFYGFLGLFGSDVCGKFYSLTTKGHNVVLIYRTNKRPVAVSVEHPEIFEQYMTKHN